MKKKIISLIAILAFVFVSISVPASVSDGSITITPASSTVTTGGTVDVSFVLSGTVGYFEIGINYNSDLLSYVADSFAFDDESIEGIYIDNVNNDEGYLEIKYKEFTNVKNITLCTITFEAADAEALEGAASAQVDITAQVLKAVTGSGEEEMIYDKDGAKLVFDLVGASVSVVDAHTAPVVTAVISGSGMVDEELSGEVTADDETSKVEDPWGLEPTEVTYEWSKVVDNEKVVLGTEATYTPTKDDLGAEITLTITATVDAEDEPTGTGTDTITIEKNDAYYPEVSDIDAPASVKAGKDIVVNFKYEDKNGIESATTAGAYIFGEDQTAGGELEATVSGNTVTVKTNKDLVDKKIVVVIYPKNVDGDTSDSVETDPIEVKKASTSSGKKIGSGPSLASGSTIDKDVDKDKDSDKDSDKDDNGGSSKTYPKESIIMTIGEKEMSIFGKLFVNDVAPQIVNSRTMLPARVVAENLGAEVAWDEEARTVTITKGEIVIILTIDSDKALLNGEEVELDSPAFIENDRTYTPMRFIAENLGAKVDWEDATKTVTITPNSK